ncbi:glycosyltransferase [Streptomyces formicae]|uniref:Glycosyltransferase n=1 Tax=Streptomyces formicae TaxID=1616117 RepID=A0ABY3WSD6_9ACTN|nr:glycosyltransferase [Streptomyces formicae]UNM15544.1 glycosyltransferase [Streptomyces formicae]
MLQIAELDLDTLDVDTHDCVRRDFAALDADALGPDRADGDARPGDAGVLALRPGPGGPPLAAGEVYVLVRLRGRPVATLTGTVPEGADPAAVLAALARERLRGSRPPAPERYGGLPRTSVVVATRERADQLARALDSLLTQDHPDFEIVVVDNAPVTDATRDLVQTKYAGAVRYVHEPVPGLAAAHNRGIAAADGAVLAFTDDDVIADPHWLTALSAPFADDPRIGCATGLILPARLTTPAQILLESHGGFAKGFAPRTYDPARPPADEPLFPFTAGRFGSGANMAFRARALKAVGGFDPATGTGTPARGGDDLYAFVRILAAGHRLRYTPDALVWHHHRETPQDLRSQAYGYGAGLTAYLTAVLARRPALLPALLARLPRGLAHARAMTAWREGGNGVPGQHGTDHHPWPRGLSRLERRGMLYGPLGYARARRRVRGLPLPWEER